MKKYLNYYIFKINKIISIGSRPLSGRNFLGTICCHHKSGGNKKKLILCDFFRRINNYGYILKIIKNNYYTSFIGGILYENGLFSYILLSETLLIGSKVYSGSFIIKNLVK
jgi:ribosomal protein L2